MEGNNSNNNNKKNYYKFYHNHNNGNKFYYKKKNNNNKHGNFYYYKKKRHNNQNQVLNENNEINNSNNNQDIKQEQNIDNKDNILLFDNIDASDFIDNENIVEENNSIQKDINIDDNQVINNVNNEVFLVKKNSEQQKENNYQQNQIEINQDTNEEKPSFFQKTGKLKYVVGVLIVIALLFGVSYSYFTYYKEDTRQADISSGEVYVRINEQSVNLTLSKMYPRTNEEARSRNDNYIDFTVLAKNTSETKEIVYTLNITNGENVQGKTRIDPQYLSIDIQEKVGNEYRYIKNAVPLSTFSFDDVVPVNTGSEIEKEYRLRLWVNDSVIISDTESGASYTQSEFANLYANVHVEVNTTDRSYVSLGEERVRRAIDDKLNTAINTCNPVWVDDNGTASDASDDITYFSGTNNCVDMNYIWYSGKLWRITAIYPDGSMKLVTENNITSIYFNAEGQPNFYTDENTTSYMYQWLNEDFYDTLYNSENIIDTTKEWDIGTTSTISSKPSESVNISSNVGLLNNYEYYNSYRCIDSSTCTESNYSTGYLNIGYYWWLLNPYDTSNAWIVDKNGVATNAGELGYGVRPSIIIKNDLQFTGSGTKTSPFKIISDASVGNANELINTRLSGEYIKLKNGNNEQMFRIIGVENNKTKVIAMDYADDVTHAFALDYSTESDYIYGRGRTVTVGDDTIYNYLVNTYYPSLVNKYGELFESEIYYMGKCATYWSYKLGICSSATGTTKDCEKTSVIGTFNIGLPRIGEMFSTQQAGGFQNSKDMWLINIRTKNGSVNDISAGGYNRGNLPTRTRNARPTVHLKSTIVIKSGSGTEYDPYVVGLPENS